MRKTLVVAMCAKKSASWRPPDPIKARELQAVSRNFALLLRESYAWERIEDHDSGRFAIEGRYASYPSCHTVEALSMNIGRRSPVELEGERA